MVVAPEQQQMPPHLHPPQYALESLSVEELFGAQTQLDARGSGHEPAELRRHYPQPVVGGQVERALALAQATGVVRRLGRNCRSRRWLVGGSDASIEEE